MIWLTLLFIAFATSANASPGQEEALNLLEADADGLFTEPVTRTERWWTRYNDEALNSVLDQALSNNPELGGAWARAELAKALSQQSAAALQPVAQFQVNGTLSPTNTMGFGVFSSIMPDMGDYFGAIEEAFNAMGAGPDGEPLVIFPDTSASTEEDPDAFMQGSALLNVSLPLDVTGQNTLNWRASRHEARAAEGNFQAQELAVATMAAEAYFEILAAREVHALTKEQVNRQQDLLELVELSFQKGAARATDVLQQRQQLAAVAARLPAASQREALAKERLRRLTGEQPPEAAANFPELGEAPVVGDAPGLLESRPDLQAAAHGFDAARLKKMAATRGYGPTVAVNGQVGWQYYQFNEFDSIQTWGAGASASLPVFSGGRIASGVRAAKANESAAANSLRAATLTALQELRSTAIADQAAAAQLQAILQQEAAALEAYAEARAQYQRGVISYIQVLPILIASQGAEASAIEARRQRLSARIQLHDALGGTWPTLSSPNGAK